jgi:hypothetical protein
MRLFEVASHFEDDLVTVIRNLVGQGDAGHTSQVYSYEALSNLMDFVKIDYSVFDKIYQSNTDLQALVRNYNEDEVVLGTQKEPEPDEQEPIDVPNGKSVDQMAHRATQYTPKFNPQ